MITHAPLVRPGPVASVYLDQAGQQHPSYQAAHRASVAALVTLELIDAGMTSTAAESTALHLVDEFAIVPRWFEELRL